MKKCLKDVDFLMERSCLTLTLRKLYMTKFYLQVNVRKSVVTVNGVEFVIFKM